MAITPPTNFWHELLQSEARGDWATNFRTDFTPVHTALQETQLRREANLRSRVNIDFDPVLDQYHARLEDLWLHRNGNEHIPSEYIREQMTYEIIAAYMEQHPMTPDITTAAAIDAAIDAINATTTTPTYAELNTAGTETGRITQPPMPPEPERIIPPVPTVQTNATPGMTTARRFPSFTLQLNTLAIELRDLRSSYNNHIHDTNFQVPARIALQHYRENLRHALQELSRLKSAFWLVQNTPIKHRAEFMRLLSHGHTSRQMRELGVVNDVKELSRYQSVLTTLENYRATHSDFLRDQRRYAGEQAQYNQRAAMLRQKPNVPKEINTREIIETVATWDNVWGIAMRVREDEGLFIRIGLKDIIMEESALDSQYDNPLGIKLAPFYFTIIIRQDGSFICPSRERNIAGLSGGNAMGSYSYDVHPHQLSDAPCFGSFGQTFIDLANKAEIIALISGIIAFYSQYNSEDSAGINATNYHPERICTIANPTEYRDNLQLHMTNWNCNVIDRQALAGGINDYLVYHRDAHNNERAPQRIVTHLCYNCDEQDVGDEGGNDYRLDCNMNRICEGCWDHSYCHECERHREDCACED